MSTDTGFFSKLRDRLGKTRGHLAGGVKRVFRGRHTIDDEIFDALEQTLIEADVGVSTSMEVVEHMKTVAKERRLESPEQLLDVLKEEFVKILTSTTPPEQETAGTRIILVAGVNGSGKTTTVGKLAAQLRNEGKTVLLGAADTFRAAAVEQLTIWSERCDVPIVKHKEGADPAAVAYDTTDAALSREIDYAIIDTAGRLHTKVNLMEELRKIRRVIEKRLPGAPHEVLLVLDATTGQNGLQQARQFTEALDVTGIVLTKLDGTAKGGIAIAIQKQLGIPIKYIGVGEGVEDLQPFDPQTFVEALLDS